MAMASALFVLLLAVAAPAAHGVQHTVGGSSGWSLSVNYATWASGQTFTVGDTLLFSYSSSLHSVDEVSKADYNNCNGGNALKTFTGGQTTIQLTKPGEMYFICPTPGHCSSGMKLAINVVASSPAPSSGTSPSILSPPSDSGSTGGTVPSSSKPSNSGTEGHFSHFIRTMLGFSLLVAGLVPFMG